MRVKATVTAASGTSWCYRDLLVHGRAAEPGLWGYWGGRMAVIAERANVGGILERKDAGKGTIDKVQGIECNRIGEKMENGLGIEKEY